MQELTDPSQITNEMIEARGLIGLDENGNFLREPTESTEELRKILDELGKDPIWILSKVYKAYFDKWFDKGYEDYKAELDAGHIPPRKGVIFDMYGVHDVVFFDKDYEEE